MCVGGGEIRVEEQYCQRSLSQIKWPIRQQSWILKHFLHPGFCLRRVFSLPFFVLLQVRRSIMERKALEKATVMINCIFVCLPVKADHCIGGLKMAGRWELY